jgi:hypothetical protein
MNSIRHLLTLPMLTLAVGAQTVPSPKLPDRPAAALTMYKGNWAPVVGADGNAPIVVANGTQVTLANNAGIVLSVGDRYADGFVTLANVQVIDVPTQNGPEAASMSIEMKSTHVYYSVDLTPDVDAPDAYALLISYPPNQHSDAPPALATVLHQIGNLTAGKRTHMKVVLPKLNEADGPGWNCLVFTAARQVRSTGMGELLPDYFNRIETASLKKRIADRIAKGVDAPIAAFRQLPLGLPDPIKAKYHGTTVKVDIKVNSDGRVVSARPVGLSDPDLSDSLQKGFADWLFLPPVKDGEATSGNAMIPLKM